MPVRWVIALVGRVAAGFLVLNASQWAQGPALASAATDGQLNFAHPDEPRMLPERRQLTSSQQCPIKDVVRTSVRPGPRRPIAE